MNNDDLLDIADVHEEKLWQVRFFDCYEGRWVNITGFLMYDDALEEFNHRTGNGTRNNCYQDGSYYDIFSSDTRMLRT